ncbi:hypothetical protein ILUMI_11846 [Ignelater luminosus]|uniref:Uncharacterized protein n=1 Tax=Ignelater luminosus TaxID=2038154 RepID=A0A8K0GCV9_IGNLU|nr:hypothetical protein ILUMI_11846 [Ignelater luminosus]
MHRCCWESAVSNQPPVAPPSQPIAMLEALERQVATLTKMVQQLRFKQRSESTTTTTLQVEKSTADRRAIPSSVSGEIADSQGRIRLHSETRHTSPFKQPVGQSPSHDGGWTLGVVRAEGVPGVSSGLTLDPGRSGAIKPTSAALKPKLAAHKPTPSAFKPTPVAVKPNAWSYQAKSSSAQTNAYSAQADACSAQTNTCSAQAKPAGLTPTPAAPKLSAAALEPTPAALKPTPSAFKPKPGRALANDAPAPETEIKGYRKRLGRGVRGLSRLPSDKGVFCVGTDAGRKLYLNNLENIKEYLSARIISGVICDLSLKCLSEKEHLRTNEKVTQFYEEILENLKADTATHNFVMQDFNCKIGMKQRDDENYIGIHGLGMRNPSGTMMMNFLEQQKLFNMNTFFQKRNNREWTCVSPDGKKSDRLYIVQSPSYSPKSKSTQQNQRGKQPPAYQM